MSQPSPPPVPPTYARPPKPRPRRRWFVAGALLLVLAAAVFVGGLVTTVSRGTATDVVAQLRGPGQPVTADVPAGERRMLFVPQGQPAPTCSVTDGTGAELELRPSVVATTVTTGGVTWVGVSTFTSPTAQVQVECDVPVDRLRVGSTLGAGFAAGIVLTVLAPLLLGGAGLTVLVVTTVLWFSRPAHPTYAAPPPPSTPPGGW